MVKNTLITTLSKEKIHAILSERTVIRKIGNSEYQPHYDQPNTLYRGDLKYYTHYDLQYKSNHSYEPTLNIKVTQEQDQTCSIEVTAYPDWFPEVSFLLFLGFIGISVFGILSNYEVSDLYGEIGISLIVTTIFAVVVKSFQYSKKKEIEKEAVQSFISLIVSNDDKAVIK